MGERLPMVDCQKTFKTYVLILLCLVLGSSCTSGDKEKVESAIDTALYYLSLPTPNCQKAIEELEKLGRQPLNPLYLRTLSSAYACRGNYSELNLFGDIDNISSNVTSFFGSLTTLGMATQTSAESAAFLDVQRALDVLLYAGGQSTPSYNNLVSIFGQRHANNLSMQTLFILLTQLGRFNYYYGNVNATGAKGLGTGTNNCFYAYPALIQSNIADSADTGGRCNSGNNPVGHPQLNIATPGLTNAIVNRRLCHGVIIVNNLIDILTNIQFSNNSALGAIVDLKDTLDDILVLAQSIPDPDFQAFLQVKSQIECEAILNANNEVGQYYFAAVFEGGLQ
jgi:hypothetical protein